MTLAETFALLRSMHRSAPFLFFDGNTFAEMGRQMSTVLFADLRPLLLREISSAAAHFIAGVLDEESLHQMIEEAIQDTDNDGIGDAYEMLHFLNLTTADGSTDSDGDGVSDVLEYAANTNPTDNSDYLRITHQEFHPTLESLDPAFTSVDLTFTSVRNRLYSIEQNPVLVAPWLDSGLGIFPPHPADPTTTRAMNFGPGPRRFFRVLAHRPLAP